MTSAKWRQVSSPNPNNLPLRNINTFKTIGNIEDQTRSGRQRTISTADTTTLVFAAMAMTSTDMFSASIAGNQ